ncbi:Concanavalin A-like lectin/glucanase, subgroup [Artemisia annua]|uniref:Concanavalin A-like lectin/glucanase, subgroup n=1 Tax=Artemisia annua TaxID=35608 RepID=A0A2U1Q8T1_ARTAN|nr:Concanavalin A-like lectin/glucanase, subgroup [Artemisia annua]
MGGLGNGSNINEVGYCIAFDFFKHGKLTKCGGSVPTPRATLLDWIDMVNGFQNGSVFVYILRVAKVVIDAKKCSQQSTSTAFGVLLLEMLTGKAPVKSTAGQDEVVDLPRWIQSMVRQEWIADVFDVELIKYQDNVDKEMVQMPTTTYQATYFVLTKIDLSI